MNQRPIRFCPDCGSPTQQALPNDGDTKLRAICTNSNCAKVHYQNPLNVVGTLPLWWGTPDAPLAQPQVLLCLRNIEPRKGYWTLPAGFMELGESTADGALRETFEEAGAQIALQNLYSVINVPRANQVHFFYLAKLLSKEFSPGVETQEARLFSADEIPWKDIAFKTVACTLQHYFGQTNTPMPDSILPKDVLKGAMPQVSNEQLTPVYCLDLI